jgi:hypothetical protein
LKSSEEAGSSRFCPPPPLPKSKKIKLPDFATRQKRIFGDRVLPGNIIAEERESYKW